MAPGSLPDLVPASLFAFAACLALLLALLRSPLSRRVLDQPNARSLHRQPVPRIGGLAIVASTVATGSLWAAGSVPWIALAVLLLVSLLDDVRGVPAAARLLVHLAVAAAASLPFLAGHGVALFLIMIALTAWSANLYNFMDGMDGLAGGMAVSGFLFLALAALAGGDADLAVLCAAVAAAAAAFLCFNFAPARIFLGDCGSIPLGFLAAWAGARGYLGGAWPWWYPCFVFAPFALDATVTLLRRLRARQPPWQAHREHFYQRLVRLGWTHRRTALAYYGLMLLCGACASLALTRTGALRALLLALPLLVCSLLMRVVDRWWSTMETRRLDA